MSLLETLQELKLQRKAVLLDLDAIYDKSADEAAIVDEAYRLRDGYNKLSDEIDSLEMQISSNKYSDPLGTFPPELWTQIIEDVIQEHASYENRGLRSTMFQREDAPKEKTVRNLLLLTTVSRLWYESLTSIPTLWTTTVIDDALKDCYTLAEATLSLSKGCHIDLQLRLSTVSWERALYLAVQHRDRIRSLSIWTNSKDTFRTVMWDLVPLSSLESLSIREMPRTSLGELNDFPLSEFPALQRVYFPPSYDYPVDWLPLVASQYISVPSLSQDHVDRLMSQRQLARLYIAETSAQQAALSGKFPPSLLDLDCSGPNTLRLLPLFPAGLTMLQIDCRSLQDTQRVLQSLVSIHSLQVLRLQVRAKDSTAPETLQATSKSSAARLKLLEINTQYVSHRERDRLLDNLYQQVRVAFPYVEHLEVVKGEATPVLLLYINDISSLHVLELVGVERPSGESISLDKKQMLQVLHWSGLLSSTASGKPAPHNVEQVINTKSKRKITNPKEPNAFTEVNLGWYLGTSFPFQAYVGLASSSSPSSPGPFFTLCELRISPSRAWDFSTHARDVVEAIALRPYDLPGLGSLGIKNSMVEWDMIILALERRNISPPKGISLLQIKFEGHDIASSFPQLGEAVFPLFLGRYSDRKPLSSYSLDAVAERMVDREQLGCSSCCHLMRGCDIPTQDPNDDLGFSTFIKMTNVGGIREESTLLPGSRVPYPPLNRRDEQWLAGTMERRRRHYDRLEKAIATFDRYFDCYGEGYRTTSD